MTNKNLNKELNWEVVSNPVFNGNGNVIKNYQELTRSDNSKTLSIMASTYHHTPNEIFKGIVNDFCEQAGYQLEGFHEMYGGNKLFAYLKNPSDVDILGNKVDEWLSIGNSHNGTSRLFFSTVQLMMRCQNQFSRVHRGAFVSMSHTKGHLHSIEKMRKGIKKYNEVRKQLIEQYEQMNEVAFSSKEIEFILNSTLKISKAEIQNKKVSTRKINMKNSLRESIERETSDLGTNGFGVLQGVSHYTTHKKEIKHSNFGNIVGSLADINALAFRNILRICKERKRSMIAVN